MPDTNLTQEELDARLEEAKREGYNLRRAEEIEGPGLYFVVEFGGESYPIPERLEEEWEELKERVSDDGISEGEAFNTILERAGYRI